jgi:ribose transport system ATP-binding protein
VARGVSSLLSVQGVRKSFGPTVALGGVDLEARAGEVHAVLGENGAGKSTLMSLLGGITTPDAGSLLLDGRRYAPRNPGDARAAGVAMVHQELSLCPHLSVAENMMLGREPTQFGLIAREALRERASRALEAAAGPQRSRALALGGRVGDLPLADRQIIEIARAMAEDRCRVLILDEPTSSLGREEARVLFDRIRAMRAQGLCILYISHFIEEVKELADRFTVLRDGRTVATGNVGDVSVSELVTTMAGKAIFAAFPRATRAPGETVLACEDVAGAGGPSRASFELRRGEVLGIAGLVGAGRTELLRVLFGLDSMVGGRVRALGHVGMGSPAGRIAQGFGMLSEDRKGEGLALTMSVADNLTLSKLATMVRSSWQRGVAARWVDRLGIRCRGVQEAVLNLSGGNQQKVALGRLMHQDAEILLLDQPTRGIDVAAKTEVHRLIEELAVAGRAILLVSDDLSELRSTCDRIAVMRRGVLGPARPVNEWTEESLLSAALLGAVPTQDAS